MVGVAAVPVASTKVTVRPESVPAKFCGLAILLTVLTLLRESPEDRWINCVALPVIGRNAELIIMGLYILIGAVPVLITPVPIVSIVPANPNAGTKIANNTSITLLMGHTDC